MLDELSVLSPAGKQAQPGLRLRLIGMWLGMSKVGDLIQPYGIGMGCYVTEEFKSEYCVQICTEYESEYSCIFVYLGALEDEYRDYVIRQISGEGYHTVHRTPLQSHDFHTFIPMVDGSAKSCGYCFLSLTFRLTPRSSLSSELWPWKYKRNLIPTIKRAVDAMLLIFIHHRIRPVVQPTTLTRW